MLSSMIEVYTCVTSTSSNVKRSSPRVPPCGSSQVHRSPRRDDRRGLRRRRALLERPRRARGVRGVPDPGDQRVRWVPWEGDRVPPSLLFKLHASEAPRVPTAGGIYCNFLLYCNTPLSLLRDIVLIYSHYSCNTLCTSDCNTL